MVFLLLLFSVFCVSFFSSLIPNTGYISEASASLLDQHLGLDIVPRTELISLASPTFSYSFFDRRKKPLPEKMGSFQIFVRGFKDATICIKEFQTVSLTENLQYQFRLNFERLVILDYLIRNTGPRLFSPPF